MTDPQGRLLVDMPRWRAVTGQSPDELLGHGWLDGVHPDDRERVDQDWRDAVATRTPFDIRYRIVGPGGTMHLDVRGAPVLDDGGQVVEWIGWASDVSDQARVETARAALERQLASERHLLERVVEQAPAAIAVLSGPQHEFRFWNRRYEEIVPSGRLRRGARVAEALPEASRAIALLDRALAGETVVQREFAIRFDDERSFEGHRYYDFTYSQIADGDRPAGVLAVAVETTEQVRQRSDLQRRLQAERALAEQLQRAVLPEQVAEVEGVELAVRYLPAAEAGVGGDWYDALTLPDGRLLLVIGDVAGRGLEAATAMVQLRSALRAFAVEGCGPGEILRRLAQHCLALGLADFVTVLVGVLDTATGRLTCASAGHPPLLLVPAEGEPELVWPATGPPIGAPAGAYTESTVALGTGATVLLFTDGLVEERGRTLDATLEELRAAAAGDAVRLHELCDRLVAGRRAADDTALLALRRVGAPAPPPALERRYPALPVTVSAVRAAVADIALACGFGEEQTNHIKLAVSEATTNAVLHAYRDAAQPGDVAVRAEVAEGELRVVVKDSGLGIRPREDSPGLGLGLGLMSALTTRVDFLSGEGGTEVHMAWSLSAAGGPAAQPARR